MVTLAYSTIVTFSGLGVCDGSVQPNRTVRIENSILVASAAFDALDNPTMGNCSFTSTLLSRQSSAPTGTFVADPLFVDPSGGNYRLQDLSPAIDAGNPATVPISPDLDGIVRPQGGAPDLGAHEFQRP